MPEPLVLDVGTWVVPMHGQHVSGDVVRTRSLDDHRLVVVVVDGLGHGPAAFDAASKCADALERTIERGIGEAFGEAHRELRAGRGAVAGIAIVDAATRVVETGAVGNIAVRTMGMRNDAHKSSNAVSTPGVLGSAFRRVHIERFDIEAGDVIVMHSDGVRSRFEPLRVRAADAQSAAEEIVGREGRSHDDASCAVVRVLPVSAGLPSRRPTASTGTGIDLPVRRQGDVQVAATSAREFAAGLGIGGRASWEIGIVAAELAQNVLKYGVEGVLTLHTDGEWVVVEAVDRGPGFGAAGSQPGLGEGLAAIDRLMDSSEVLSGPLGARVIARKRLVR